MNALILVALGCLKTNVTKKIKKIHANKQLPTNICTSNEKLI